MIYFKNATIYTTTKTTSRNEIGQMISTYVKDKAVEVNIQPITEESKAREWGSDIEAQYNVYTDDYFNLDDLISYNDKPYRVVKIIDWQSYRLLAISVTDEVINE